MTQTKKPLTIVMAEDDADDRFLTLEALKDSKVLNTLHCVEDGIELLNYLRHEGKYTDQEAFPRPNLILLDLNMPRMDGLEALGHIKADKHLRQIPIVILTTSKEEGHRLQGYDLGAASFITKPVTFDRLVDLMRAIGNYWLEFVELP